MYSSSWSPRLRQGDIVGPILVPLVGKEFGVLGASRSVVEETLDVSPKQVVLQADRRRVVLVSHDCEFNEEKRSKFLVARLQSVPGNLEQEQLNALRASNDIYARQEAGLDVAGLDNFLFDAVPGAFGDDQVAAFTTITALPMSMADDLRKAKNAELEHSVRLQFKAKLAWFFVRGDEDVPDEDKEPAPVFDAPPSA